ncbi:hypothetical protein PR048_024876 [Dryococelus australis]|uniref:Uncharacterized protein n=1 Tax=Dryococelus australis TaxID=614101 RepID=A0ABQ9GPR9_9NEOP|nr:hypothetical protein PR048_024876 [Dryococelus australis]
MFDLYMGNGKVRRLLIFRSCPFHFVHGQSSAQLVTKISKASMKISKLARPGLFLQHLATISNFFQPRNTHLRETMEVKQPFITQKRAVVSRTTPTSRDRSLAAPKRLGTPTFYEEQPYWVLSLTASLQRSEEDSQCSGPINLLWVTHPGPVVCSTLSSVPACEGRMLGTKECNNHCALELHA